MAQLTGQKVKDTYSKLLQLSTSGVTTTRKTIESGIGEATALTLGSNTVGLQNPYVSSVPVGTIESSAVFTDTNGQLVTRQLGSNAFDSTYPEQDYDTGWQVIPDYDPAKNSGITPITDLPADRVPKYRVINRTVHFRGNIYIPLSPGQGDPLQPAVSDIASLEQTQSSTVSTTNNGVVVNNNGTITLPSIKFNDIVVPEFDTYLAILHPLFRNGKTFNVSGDDFKFMYNTFAAIKIDTTGRLQIESLTAFEGAGPSALNVLHMNPIHEIMTRWEAGNNHNISSYENYKTYNINNTDQRVVTSTSFPVPYPFDGDGDDMTTWGGLCIVLDGLSYTVSNSISLDLIH